MIGAFVVIALVFNFWTEGRFLTPRNIFNLTIQTVSVGIMATGMVFVIVTRHIDLSVGALLATVSALMAMTQTQFLPQRPRPRAQQPGDRCSSPSSSASLAGTLIGAFHGYLVGYPHHPGLHRHAGRAVRLAQRRLVPDPRPDHRPARRTLPVARRHQRHPGRDRQLDLRPARRRRRAVRPRHRAAPQDPP